MCSLGTEGIPSLSDLGMYIVYAIHHHIHKHCKYFLFRPSVPAELSGGCSISPLPWPIAWPSHNLASEHAKGGGNVVVGSNICQPQKKSAISEAGFAALQSTGL